MVKDYGLYSQTQQEVAHRIFESIMRVFKLKKKGVACGFPRFKNIDKTKSLYYPQYGFVLTDKLKVTPFGDIKIKQHRAIEGKVKTLSLKKESSGKWFAIFTVEQAQEKMPENKGSAVGIDLGLKSFAVISDGTVIQNPRHLRAYEDKLAFIQNHLSRKIKKSRNWQKMKVKVALLHEKVKNTRADFLHKVSTRLVSRYSMIALEDLNPKTMAGQNYGKSIHDAGWGMFANMMRYKAESAGCAVVFVNPQNTTKECSDCKALSKKELWERTHECPSCGLIMDRDLNAAKVILNRATVGIMGSNACEDGTIVPPMKQEAITSSTDRLW